MHLQNQGEEASPDRPRDSGPLQTLCIIFPLLLTWMPGMQMKNILLWVKKNPKQNHIAQLLFPLKSEARYMPISQTFVLVLTRVIWLQFSHIYAIKWASLVAQMVKNLPTMQETRFQSLGLEDPLEKAIATHSSILAWRIPWTEEPGGLQSIGSQSVVHDWSINTGAIK